MFNGIIFNQGILKKLKRDKGINIFIKSDLKLTKKILVFLLHVMEFAYINCSKKN